jgi:DNA-binding MarR family transcriptional regulator
MTKSPPISQSLREWLDVFMHQSMRDMNQFAKSMGLSMPQLSILMQLHYKGTCGLSEISERFDISAAAASQLAEKLVQSGYLERAEDPKDRRAKNLKLTAHGIKLIHEGIQQRNRWSEALVSQLGVEDKAKVSETLEILTKAARELDRKK